MDVIGASGIISNASVFVRMGYWQYSQGVTLGDMAGMSFELLLPSGFVPNLSIRLVTADNKLAHRSRRQKKKKRRRIREKKGGRGAEKKPMTFDDNVFLFFFVVVVDFSPLC